MNNTVDTTEYAKATKHETWQEIVPFLRTGDIVTVYHNHGVPEHDVTVCVSDKSQLITAGERHLRWPDGTLNSNVTDVFLHSACVRINELEPLATSLKTGDVVRATFVYVGSSAITLEGTAWVDEDGDALLVVEDEGGDDPERYYLTFYRGIADTLRVLEVIDPGEDAPEPDEPPEPLTFATRATETPVHPGAGTFWGLQYATAGLSGKVGDLSEKVAKMHREGGYLPDSEHLWGGDRADLTAALHDVAEYLAMTCSEAGIDPEEVLRRSPNKSTLISPDTTDLRAWLDGLPIGATIADVSVSNTENDTGYWEATKVRSDVFIASNGFRWQTVDLVGDSGIYRLLGPMTTRPPGLTTEPLETALVSEDAQAASRAVARDSHRAVLAVPTTRHKGEDTMTRKQAALAASLDWDGSK